MDLEQMGMLKSKIDCSYEVGVWVEIDSFMEYREDQIIERNITYSQKDEQYKIVVKLKDYSIEQAQNFFKEFVDFIEYGGATFYKRIFLDNEINYYLLSEMDSHKGLFVKLTIS